MSSSNAIRSLSNALGGAGADGDPTPLAASAAPSSKAALEARLAALQREAEIASLKAQLAVLEGGGAASAASSAVVSAVPTKASTSITLVIDVSGSMDLTGEGEQNVFSRLDLARRAALLAAYMMREGDTLSIVTFSTDAQVLLPPTQMTATNKERTRTLLESLRPGGSTNLSAGLRKAFTLASSANILVLTDGEADAGQTVGTLSDEIRHADYHGTLSMVGFTYASRSDVLSTLAALGHGSFGFVSSSDMLMTVILNWISRHLANEPLQAPSADVSAYIAVLKTAYNHAMKGYYPAARDAIEAFRVSLPAGSIFLEDIGGDVGLAVSSAATFQKWGSHHLLALISSHEQQHCGNFKDPSVQPYITPRFKAIQEEGVRVFESLPPLVGSHAVSAAHAAATALSGRAASQVYYNPSGGCFHGKSPIALANGSTLPIRDLRRGMKVKTLTGTATIVAAIKYCVPSGFMDMTKVNDQLTITPYHPLQQDGVWVFPRDHFPTSSVALDAVYNLVLDTQHHVLVGGVVCCTLAHGLKGPVIEHPYFGTADVIKDLMIHPTAADDLIVYKEPRWITDPVIGLICKTVDNAVRA
jgi:Mg-chelatase subunit ChlD